MKTEGLESPTLRDDDATVNELMEALDLTSDQLTAFSNSGYMENPIETAQDEHPEDLIAPEALFPDEASSSRDLDPQSARTRAWLPSQ